MTWLLAWVCCSVARRICWAMSLARPTAPRMHFHLTARLVHLPGITPRLAQALLDHALGVGGGGLDLAHRDLDFAGGAQRLVGQAC